MKTFKDIKAGDVLLRNTRRFKSEDGMIREWEEVSVEKVTPAFYFVDGEKYRKDSEGKNFMNNFYFPGQNGAPQKATPRGEFDETMMLYKKCDGLSFVNPRLNNVRDLKKRAELADKLLSVLDEIKSHW